MSDWQRLATALREHEAWYGDARTQPDVGASIYMGSEGSFSGGIYIDGDRLSRDEWGDDELVVDGTLEEVIAGLIAALAQYRADREREKAEIEAEEARV